MINLYNIDCMEYMRTIPDNCYDLAIVDPPFGIGMHKAQGQSKKHKKKWIGNNWDKKKPDKKYFTELFRISKNQIIWGGNYFVEYLKSNKKWLIWDKVMREDQSHCELAWTSFNGAERIFTFSRSNLQGFRNPFRFHPTEKPIDLYRWLLKNYAKPNDKILDTHGGSMSIAIACHDMGFDLDLCELDKDYFEAGKKRYENHISQVRMF